MSEMCKWILRVAPYVRYNYVTVFELEAYCWRRKFSPKNLLFSNVWFTVTSSETVASLGWARGRTRAYRPGWHPPGGWHPSEKNIFVGEFTKNSGQTRSNR